MDASGKIVGKITECDLFDSRDMHIIRDKHDKIAGRIETNFYGERVIKDE
jgi:hypothetical protein